MVSQQSNITQKYKNPSRNHNEFGEVENWKKW